MPFMHTVHWQYSTYEPVGTVPLQIYTHWSLSAVDWYPATIVQVMISNEGKSEQLDITRGLPTSSIRVAWAQGGERLQYLLFSDCMSSSLVAWFPYSMSSSRSFVDYVLQGITSSVLWDVGCYF